MVETIESFVGKLQSEGVQAGQKAAGKILEDAEKQAQQTIDNANTEAERIIAKGKAEAAQLIERGKTELELASRDTIMRLRETLEGSLSRVLAGPVETTLNDVEFLKELLHNISMEYVKAEIQSKDIVKIRVRPELHAQLADWAIKELRSLASSADASLDLKGTLRQAGFECNVSGATIEITEESVVATLKELVSPKLREVFGK